MRKIMRWVPLQQAIVLSLVMICLQVRHVSTLTAKTTVPKTGGNFDKQPQWKSTLTYRPGQPSDSWELARRMALNLQNPLAAREAVARFVVATATIQEESKLVGWVQLAPIGYNLRSSDRYDARPGSFDAEQEVDNQMLDEFVWDDSIQVPTGWASLPWTEEYRAMEEAIQARQKRREDLVAQQSWEMRQNRVALWELKSLYVEPSYRGHGVGRGLVQYLKDEYESTGKEWSHVYLTSSNPQFFMGLNCFTKVSSKPDVPLAMTIPDNGYCLRGCENDISQ